MRFLDSVHAALSQLEERSLLRAPHVVHGAHGPEILIDGQRVLDLCSNNYLGLANDPRIAEAAAAALQQSGLGAAASPHISGTSVRHREAEAALARFVQLPSALIFSSGYSANTGVIPALAAPSTVIFSDRLNHASLIDGCRLSRASVHVYEHLDCAHLERLLRTHRARASTALVVTESLFSMDGDLAPLTDLRALCDRFDAGLLVDEAHALGVLGPRGAGSCAAQDITPDVLVGTLGKALGCSGAFVAGATAVVRLVENRARSHIFSTAPSSILAAAAVRACELVADADDARAALASHAVRLRAGLRALGYAVAPGTSAIIPVHVGAAAEVMRLSRTLLGRGVFVHGIRPPTVAPGTCRLRVTPMATHSGHQLDTALDAFQRARE